jgi:hypothetical protein
LSHVDRDNVGVAKLSLVEFALLASSLPTTIRVKAFGYIIGGQSGFPIETEPALAAGKRVIDYFSPSSS